MPKISLITLTYNSSRHIDKLFKSLFAEFDEDLKSKKIEIVVVDNKSTDDTVKKVKKIGGNKIRLIENDTNEGFAKGINLGVKNSTGEFVLTINPDAEFKSGDIFKALSLFEDKKVGVVGGKMVDKNGDSEKSAGRFIKTAETFLLSVGLDEVFRVRVSPEKISEVDFVSGGFMLVSRKLFEENNGFDENFFMYIEDMEFCYRLKKSGYKVIFDPSIVIQHEGQGSSSRGFAVKNIFSGIYYFHKKHGSIFSQLSTKFLLRTKALSLVLMGKILNNKYLEETYSEALKA